MAYLRHCSSHADTHSDPDPTHVNDVPPALPAEGAWTPEAGDLPNWDAMPRRNRRRRRRGAYPVWLKYMAWCVGLAALMTAAQLAVHAIRSDPRDARVYAERELRLSALKPNEKVVAEVSVWQRPAVDYFRATRGLLVLTDAAGDSANPIGGRIIYLGLEPRDPLSPPDAPPTFDQRDWLVDTLVAIAPKRTLFYLSRGIRIESPRERLSLGVPSGASRDANALLAGVNKKYAALRSVGWQRREARRARDRERLQMQNAGRREWYHTVLRGQALASIARMYNTTPEQVRALNNIVGDRIKGGQRLIVKGRTRTPIAFPAGIVPDTVP